MLLKVFKDMNPSTPLMPIPTWAAVIIFTSLAPSPMANVVTCGF